MNDCLLTMVQMIPQDHEVVLRELEADDTTLTLVLKDSVAHLSVPPKRAAQAREYLTQRAVERLRLRPTERLFA